jgi:hypothetical protein
MLTKEIGRNLFMIDPETGGIHNNIASCVLKGAKTIIVKTGPSFFGLQAAFWAKRAKH